ncbi:MAG: peptide chain release factor 1 [Neomegalonema sp.]|nr:peptide chain release factor 1 [Neomegalonema sp.]
MSVTIPREKIDQILNRFEFLEAKMADGVGADEYVKLSREYSALEGIARQAKAYRQLQADLREAQAMLDDPEMREFAEEELAAIEQKMPLAEREMQLALIPKDEADDKSAILEIRAGTGGDEAALFAGDLFAMYTRYAAEKGWKIEVMEESPGEVGGFKEIIASVKGDNVFGALKFESGVHRVQRVPATESGGRIHTSAATVAVLPEAEEIDIEIRNEDIRIDTMRASGAGGQHVNTTDSAVRITHIPTGIVVTSSEKSQHQNRARAMQVLRARLYDTQRQAADAARAADRKGQVGSGDRSERIRTYNFPQGRVSDHRINLTLYKLDQVMQGALDEFVEALQAADQAEKLAEMENS